MPSFSKGRALSGALGALVAGALVAGCAGHRDHVAVPAGITTMAPADIDLEGAASQNQGRLVSDSFSGGIRVLDDAWGLGAVEAFYPDSDSLIIAQATDAAQLRAASLAVGQHVPMVTYDDSVRSSIIALVDVLGVTRILLVGEVPLAETSGSLQVIQDPGTNAAMGELTAFQPTSQVVGRPDRMVQAVAGLDPAAHTELKAAWEPTAQIDVREGKRVAALPAQSPRDGQMAPIIVATPDAPVAAVATAKAYGGQVRVMATGDPTETKASFAMVAGLADGPLVALGKEFGDVHLLSDRIRQGWSE